MMSRPWAGDRATIRGQLHYHMYKKALFGGLWILVSDCWWTRYFNSFQSSVWEHLGATIADRSLLLAGEGCARMFEDKI